MSKVTRGELDPMTLAFIQMSGVFAELERNMISERVKSGIKNAKAHGKKLGRPATTQNDIPKSFLKYYDQYLYGYYNVSELAKLSGLSRTTIYKYIELLKTPQEEPLPGQYDIFYNFIDFRI